MPHVSWSPGALRDLDRLTVVIAESRPNSAKRAGRGIRAGVQQFRKYPESGRVRSPLAPSIREWTIPFGRSAYVILYQYKNGNISILAVQHGRENRI